MKRYFPTLAFVLFLAACGQEPSFFERQIKSTGGGSSSGGSVDDHGTGGPHSAAQGTPGAEGDAVLPGEGANDWTPGWAGGDTTGDKDGVDPTHGTTTGGGTDGPLPSDVPAIPAAEDGDLPALHSCLAKWKDHPFKGTVDNYHKMAASVAIGGTGNVIKDTWRTSEPHLILVAAGVNVGGSPTYSLLNPNGYYCIKVNVNVSTVFTVNLHCNARLADQKVNVNVDSIQSDVTSAVGVHVLSTVQVNSVRPEGDPCIR